MGKGTVLANLGQGRYTVAIDTGATSATSLLAKLQAEFAALETQITQATNAVASLNSQVQALNAAWAAELATYAANPSADTAAMEKALSALRTKENERDAKQRELTTMILNRGELAKRINVIQDKNYSPTYDIWCADYTVDASGEVATIEIPGEPQDVLIMPSGAAHTDSDGQLFARELMTGPQVYFNAAILPGWQKFKPTYRKGRITSISGNFADIVLDEVFSSIPRPTFGVNQTSTLQNVQIQYMDCNGEVFSVNDHVIIKFNNQNWSNPKIIGFANNPKTCGKYFVFAELVGIYSFEDFNLNPFYPALNGYFGNNNKYLWNTSEIRFDNAIGQDGVWIGSSGKTVSWKVYGDQYNYLYAIYKSQKIDLIIPEYQNWINAKNIIYGNSGYWYNVYEQANEFVISGAAVYEETIGNIKHDVLYFVASLIDASPLYGSNNGSVQALYFYKKDLLTNTLTKISEKLFYMNNGDLLSILDDSRYGPIRSYPESMPNFGIEKNVPSNTICKFAFEVSFHPTQIQAVCSVYQNNSPGILYITSSSFSFSATGHIAAAYHPEDGRLCTASGTGSIIDGSFGWTITLSEGGDSFSRTKSNGYFNVTGVVGRLNVCYPQNNVRFTWTQTDFGSIPGGTYTRNFFNNQYTETYNSYLLPGGNLFIYNGRFYNQKDAVKLVFAKNKYFALFYKKDSNPAILHDYTASILSSEFTEQNWKSASNNSLFNFNHNLEYRIGYSD